MADMAIQVNGLSKEYKIGGKQERYKTLRDTLVKTALRPVRAVESFLRNERKKDLEKIWAIRDISFEVKPGEAIGIIGRNGAGKSTLLKILSRITEPTEGYADINGRVGSLLEVGTGFHPELTGRENVYLNGAILGMGRKEIKKKFDEIVDFAEVEKFIYTPVKHYSSGMYLRLAFAVAAHLEPNILLVDEVLAVGDAAFQKKCLGKMEDVSKEGRTVLFVSHNMAAVESLCSKGILLEAGRLTAYGPMKEVMTKYLSYFNSQCNKSQDIKEREDRSGNGAVRFVSFHLEDHEGHLTCAPQTGQGITLVFGYESYTKEYLRRVTVSFAIRNIYGTNLILHRTNFNNQDFDTIPPVGEFRCTIPRFPLVTGRYRLVAAVQLSAETADLIEDIAYLDVEAGDFFGTGQQGWPHHSPFLVDGLWSVTEEPTQLSNSNL